MRLDEIQQEMYTAMKARRKDETAALRLLLSSLKSAEKENREPLTDEQEIAVLQREAKQRREAETEYRAAGRTDRADQEAFELDVVLRYLPPQLSEAEVGKLVEEAVAATGASSPKELGRVMGALMPKVKGLADGNLVRRLLQERLSG